MLPKSKAETQRELRAGIESLMSDFGRMWHGGSWYEWDGSPTVPIDRTILVLTNGEQWVTLTGLEAYGHWCDLGSIESPARARARAAQIVRLKMGTPTRSVRVGRG